MSEETKTVITAALLIFAAAAWIWPLAMGIHLEQEARKKRNEPPEYDERQRIARLRAGNHALYALLSFLLVWTIADQFGRFDWTGSMPDMTLCALLLSWSVWAGDCILHDGFVSWKDKRKDANASVLTYCISMLFFVRAFCASEVCASWAPFLFACGNAAAMTAVVIWKARKEKQAAAGEAP